MNVIDLIARLQAHDIRLHLEEGKLKINAPKGALSSELLAEVKEHKASITAFLGEVKADGKTAIPRRPSDAPAILSYAQQRLWFLDQLEGPSATYNMPAALRLEGALDVAALRLSIQAIVDRHDSLRTHFVEGSDGPLQSIAASVAIEVPVIAVGEDEVAAKIEAFAQEPFDLARGPLLRAQVLQVGPNRYVLLTNMHHIISDGWSVGVLVGEFVELYSARVDGRVPRLPVLPIQYADFAHWQRQWLQGQELERQLGYWRQQLADLPPLLELPTDRPRPALQGFRGARVDFALDEDLTRGLKQLGQRHGASLFMTLLAAFHLLLSRYAGQGDIAVGTPIANRTRTELEGLIGFFVNTLVLRSRISGGESFVDLLAQVRQTTLAAHEHQDVPFEQLVEALNPTRSMSHTPLFQVLFALQNAQSTAQELPGLTLSPLEGPTDAAKVDLEMALEESGAGIAGRLIYNTDLFDAARMQRMVGHWRALLQEILQRADAPLSSLRMIDAPERSLLLDEWNRTGVDYPAAAGLAQLFEQHVQRRPLAPALRHDGAAMTYRELNERANRLAHHLIERGIGRDQRVGVCLRPKADVIVALLAILKAGAAYVPMDPAAPVERLRYMIDDANLALLIGEPETLDPLAGLDSASMCMTRQWPEIAARYCAQDPAARAGGGEAAYVIYTSGSTGRPKGVRIPQRAVSRLVLNCDYVTIEPGMRLAQVSNFAFDAATFEIWGALLNGGELVLVDHDVLLNPPELERFIADERIDFLFLTTALFNLVAEQAPQAFAPLNTLLFGGEAVDPRWVRRILQHGRPRRLLHVYGPTENTTFSTWFEVREVLEGARTVPIGKPISNSRCYVLDGQMHPVAIGVPGELYVGGDGLALDYLERPELTRERFVDDPFVANGRLYRSGDLVRWGEDGQLEFMARLDHQVKLRGFRIELGEIEAALMEQPAVSNAVVVLREFAPGDKRLLAYVAADAKTSPDSLRTALRSRLPDYMLPSAIVPLDALPLTPNGKVDRAALPEPPEDLEHAGYVEPSEGTQAQLAAIWAEVLKRPRVGAHDNFFDSGGHSLLATQVVTRIREQFGIALPVRALFEAPSVAALAIEVDQLLSLVGNPLADQAGAELEEIEF